MVYVKVESLIKPKPYCFGISPSEACIGVCAYYEECLKKVREKEENR